MQSINKKLIDELMNQYVHFEYISCKDEKALFMDGYTGIKTLSDKQLIQAMAKKYDDVIYFGDWEGLWVFPYGNDYEIHRFKRGSVVEKNALVFV